MKEIKNIEVLKLNRETLKEIKNCMDVYSENGDLYNEYGIEEYANLFNFEVEFDNGYTCSININSGQCNCYIDYIVYNPNGCESTTIIDDTYLINGDIIEFDVDGEHFEIKIEAI